MTLFEGGAYDRFYECIKLIVQNALVRHRLAINHGIYQQCPWYSLEFVYLCSHMCIQLAKNNCEDVIRDIPSPLMWPFSTICVDRVVYCLFRAQTILIFGMIAAIALPVECNVDAITLLLAIVFAVRPLWRGGYKYGWTPLHRIAELAIRPQRVGNNCATIGRPFDCAMQLLEGDYQKAISGARWFNVKSTQSLLAARGHMTGRTALAIATGTTSGSEQVVDSDFVQLLRGWESSPLAIPPPACLSKDASIMINPQLTPFQSFLAHGVRDLLDHTTIHSVAYQVLGYLTPMDALSNWNEWSEDIANL